MIRIHVDGLDPSQERGQFRISGARHVDLDDVDKRTALIIGQDVRFAFIDRGDDFAVFIGHGRIDDFGVVLRVINQGLPLVGDDDEFTATQTRGEVGAFDVVRGRFAEVTEFNDFDEGVLRPPPAPPQIAHPILDSALIGRVGGDGAHDDQLGIGQIQFIDPIGFFVFFPVFGVEIEDFDDLVVVGGNDVDFVVHDTDDVVAVGFDRVGFIDALNLGVGVGTVFGHGHGVFQYTTGVAVPPVVVVSNQDRFQNGFTGDLG